MRVTITGHRKETAILAHAPEEPPVREVRKQIRIEIETLLRSYKERDGVIRDEDVIYEIGCLLKALKLLEPLNMLGALHKTLATLRKRKGNKP